MFEQFLLFLKRLFFATGYFSSGSYPKPLTAEETSILRTNLLKLVHTRLTEREQKIILMRYGIEEGATPLTQLQTARKLGISRSYVSRIETRALEKLREAMQEGE